MSLISLLIALFAERKLSGKIWQFRTYFQGYVSLVRNLGVKLDYHHGWLKLIAFILVPTVATHYLFSLIDNQLLSFILSTLILIPCFGCVKIRESYKNYILASLRGDQESCYLEQSRLQNAHALGEESFGLTLVWLNYTYYAAVMVFFVLFGAAGALFYRLLVTVNETYYHDFSDEVPASAIESEDSQEQSVDVELNLREKVLRSERLLALIDWFLVRLVSIGYLLVGHFSRGVKHWLKSLLEFESRDKAKGQHLAITGPREFLTTVAFHSQDNQVTDKNCTNSICALVQLVKRNLLFMLAVTALLTLTGYIN